MRRNHVIPLKKEGPSLTIYTDKSVYVNSKGVATEFAEGATNAATKMRLGKISTEFTAGYLDAIILDCLKHPAAQFDLLPEHAATLTLLAHSITSEVGRALVGLMFLQLAVKDICPAQSIRLHKGGGGEGNFSWRDGISMRVLDKNFVTPALRKYGLVKLNKDGFMMTRTLAENYPYTPLYKAAIRGARGAWLQIVDWVELQEMDANAALRLLITLLLQRNERFNQQVDEMLLNVQTYCNQPRNLSEILALINRFVEETDYSARIFEIAIHAFMQALDDAKLLGGHLKVMSQMRSANKKHGNIGDIELTHTHGRMDIFEAWDAKYGKPNLREELEELADKLIDHPQVERVGFITNTAPDLRTETTNRMADITAAFSVEVQIVTLADWVGLQMTRAGADPDLIGLQWLVALAESIGQKRRAVAPIDEPTNAWVATLTELMTAENNG